MPSSIGCQSICPPDGSRPSGPIVDELYSVIVGRAEPGARIRRYHLLYAGAVRLARTMDLEEVFERLESDLHVQTALNARDLLFVHAGVVAWHGQAIVLPGRSQSGKSTLVASLVRAGATYYSDEYAVLDGRGRVHPYSKPLSLRDEAGGRSRRYPVKALGGGRAGTRPLPIGLVAVTAYRPGGRWCPRALSSSRAVLALLDNTLVARAQPAFFVLKMLRVAVSGAAALQGKRGEANAVARPLLKRLEAGSAT